MGAAEKSVAVVGGGIAGLSAAWELQRLGVAVTVLERSGAPGGRASSERAEHGVLEPLSPALSSRDRALLGWISELGVQDDMLPLRPLRVSYARRGHLVECDPRGPLDFARLPGVPPHQGLRLLRLPRLLRRFGARLDAGAPERAAVLDDRSVADFARLYFGRRVLERWIAPFATAGALGDEEETSRVLFLLRHLEHFGARAGLPRTPLSRLAEAAAEGLDCRFDTEVVEIAPSRHGLELVCRRGEREAVFATPGAVLALPAPEAARVAAPALGTGERETLERMEYTPALTVVASTCRPLTEVPREIRVPHAEGGPLETALVEPGLSGGRVGAGYGALVLRATGRESRRAAALPDETVAKELIDAFEPLLPGTRATVEGTRVLRVARAWPRFGVGHYRALARLARIGDEARGAGRPLALAGDYRSDPSWAGAYASGVRAARELAGALA